MKNFKELISEHFSELGKKGMEKRWKNATPEERKETGRRLAEARKKAKKPM